MKLSRSLEPGFVIATEKAAIAAAQTMGYGDEARSDQVASEAMRQALDRIHIAGRVVAGESAQSGDRRLRTGEVVGAHKDKKDALEVDLAVDPLEGTRLCSTGTPGAMTALAVSMKDGLVNAPGAYMEKIIVGPTARDAVHLDAPVLENLRNIAHAFDRSVSDLTVVVLDRPRHRRLVADIRDAGARIRLIPDGDLAAGIATAMRGTGVHAVMGIGGTREGALVAAAIRCLGGTMQARLVALDEEQEQQLAECGITDLQRIYTTEELARGESIVFSATGVTDNEFVRGVRFFGGGCRTSTLLMSVPDRTVRFIETIHLDDSTSPVVFY